MEDPNDLEEKIRHIKYRGIEVDITTDTGAVLQKHTAHLTDTRTGREWSESYYSIQTPWQDPLKHIGVTLMRVVSDIDDLRDAGKSVIERLQDDDTHQIELQSADGSDS